MKKRNRGLIAIVCIMALLISSFATYTAKISADTDYSTLSFLNIGNIYVYDHQNTKVAVAYAVCEEESTSAMATAAENWQYSTYGDNYVKIAWGDLSPYASPTKIAINGVEYTSTTGPIVDYASTLVNINAMHSAGFTTGYNTVKITKGSEYVTIVYRVGSVVAPTSAEATEQSGVPGSINVTWVPGLNPPAEQVYRIYVDGDMKRGNLTGTSAVVNNIDAGTHEVSVVGFYLDTESESADTTVSVSTGVKYNSEISIEGFQIRSNYPDDATAEEKNNVAFRTVCKAPKAGSTIKAGGKTYTVASVGTIYAKDTNTRDKQGTNVLDASYTLLNETPVTGQQYSYVGFRKYNNINVTFGYVAGTDAIVEDYKAGDTDNTYYAFTMRNMNTDMANTLWVRPFIVATDGSIVYGKTTAYTSVAEIANNLYVNSMCKNATGHEYLFDKILNNSVLSTNNNPFYRASDQKIQYGWNTNLYIGFRKVPDSWNGGQADEGQYVVVGDWKVHNSSFYDELTPGKQAAASYKGNTNDEMQVRVDNPGKEAWTDSFHWNWGIQMKLANQKAYNRLEDGRKYRMTLTYNTTKAGIMRIKTEGNSAAGQEYMQPGHDLVYDFDAVAGGNKHSIEFTYNKSRYVSNPGADPSIVLCPGRFNVYPFGDKDTPNNDLRSRLHIKYLGQYAETTTAVEDVGGFPTGTIISDVDITFTEIDEFSPDSPNVLH